MDESSSSSQSIRNRIHQSLILLPGNLSSIESHRNNVINNRPQMKTLDKTIPSREKPLFSSSNGAFVPHNRESQFQNYNKSKFGVPTKSFGRSVIDQNRSFLDKTSIGTDPQKCAVSNTQTESDDNQVISKNIETRQQKNMRLDASNRNNIKISSDIFKDDTQTFSHQQRRRPVYFRGNAELQSAINNQSNCIRIPEKTSPPENIITPTDHSSAGYSSNVTSPVSSTFSDGRTRRLQDAGVPSGNNISQDPSKVCPSSLVYLRPEQNIPDVFFASRRSATFKPIVEVSTKQNVGNEMRRDSRLGDVSKAHATESASVNNIESSNGSCSEMHPSIDNDSGISRDDIVVTMRSVNV